MADRCRSVVNSVASGSGVGTGAGTVAATAAGDRRRAKDDPESDQRDDQQAQQQHEITRQVRWSPPCHHAPRTRRPPRDRGSVPTSSSRAGISDTDRRDGRERRRVECHQVLVLEGGSQLLERRDHVPGLAGNDGTTGPIDDPRPEINRLGLHDAGQHAGLDEVIAEPRHRGVPVVRAGGEDHDLTGTGSCGRQFARRKQCSGRGRSIAVVGVAH